jgi:hypothetical protein
MAAAADSAKSKEAEAPAASAAAPAPAPALNPRYQLWFDELKAGLETVWQLCGPVSKATNDWTDDSTNEYKAHAITTLSRSYPTLQREYNKAASAAPHFTSTHTKTYKIFLCRATFAVSPLQMFELLRDIPGTLKWNSNITAYRIIHQFTPEVELNCCQAASAAGGMISARDFVTLRSCAPRAGADGCYLVCGVSVVAEGDALAVPVPSGVIRGWNGPSGYVRLFFGLALLRERASCTRSDPSLMCSAPICGVAAATSFAR